MTDPLPKDIRRKFYREADELEQQDADEKTLLWRITWTRKRANEVQDPPPVAPETD